MLICVSHLGLFRFAQNQRIGALVDNLTARLEALVMQTESMSQVPADIPKDGAIGESKLQTVLQVLEETVRSAMEVADHRTGSLVNAHAKLNSEALEKEAIQKELAAVRSELEEMQAKWAAWRD